MLRNFFFSTVAVILRSLLLPWRAVLENRTGFTVLVWIMCWSFNGKGTRQGAHNGRHYLNRALLMHNPVTHMLSTLYPLHRFRKPKCPAGQRQSTRARVTLVPRHLQLRQIRCDLTDRQDGSNQARPDRQIAKLHAPT